MTTDQSSTTATEDATKTKKHNASQIKCGKIRQEFIDCVMQYSECVRQPGTTFAECLKPPNVFPEECQGLRTSLYQCKRSLVCT